MQKKIMNKIGIYPGTFDPFTNGHLYLLKKSLKIFDTVILAISKYSNKNLTFSISQRIKFAKLSTTGIKNISIKSFNELVVNFALKEKSNFLIRGIRDSSDFAYEMKMLRTNYSINSKIETIFITNYCKNFISSSMLKEIAFYKGDIKKYVSKKIIKEIEKKFLNY
ncbi:pantetheine-phosphate adenylyltransferase [bacterium endosymbiont of Pedicinus badii]|uniref:pantetheine-phosphate adenylyltransferase n=1 Tax=bacterium endosymbiont of Pedicinus badii TaxID=1719126 RepID=UPI0009BB1C80|nr:pantetheine-phosphate adenylyltransferase [bacterium endosymbiont of Pedicinus badii]OQM34060.1 hypothetical protein AOQ89_01735 [bacterium endosymbiont of Pedicinus badii]